MPTPNPYAPPVAAALEPPPGIPERPRAVQNSVLLIAASFALSCLLMVPSIGGEPLAEEPFSFLVVALVLVVSLGITAFLGMKMLRGKNWARWTMLGYMLIGWGLSAPGVLDDTAYSPLTASITLTSFVLDAAAMWLVFVGEGAKWYRAVAARG